MRGNKFVHNHLPSNKTLPECLGNHIAFSAFLIIIKIPPIFPFPPSIIPYKSAFYQVIHSFSFSPLIFFFALAPFSSQRPHCPGLRGHGIKYPPPRPALRLLGCARWVLILCFYTFHHPPLLPFSSWVFFLLPRFLLSMFQTSTTPSARRLYRDLSSPQLVPPRCYYISFPPSQRP